MLIVIVGCGVSREEAGALQDEPRALAAPDDAEKRGAPAQQGQPQEQTNERAQA